MGHFGKIFGGIVGGLVGGPVGAALGVALGSGLDAGTSAPTSSSASPPTIDVTARGWTDEGGELCEVVIKSHIPDDCLVRFNIQTQAGEYIKAERELADDDGDFSVVRRIVNGSCACYIPYASLKPVGPGPFLLAVTVLRLLDERVSVVGSTRLIQEIRHCGPWDSLIYEQPFAHLLMAVATADGVLSPKAVRAMRLACESALSGDEDPGRSREWLKRAKREIERCADSRIEYWARVCRAQFEGVSPERYARHFSEVAKADGEVSPRKLQRIRLLLLALGYTEAQFDEFVDLENLDLRSHFAVLGLERSASWESVRAAHRRLMFEYHPDRHVNKTPQERIEAERRAIEIQRAYSAIKATLVGE